MRGHIRFASEADVNSLHSEMSRSANSRLVHRSKYRSSMDLAGNDEQRRRGQAPWEFFSET
jgi:hypothetical protein